MAICETEPTAGLRRRRYKHQWPEEHPEIGLSGARKLASVVRGRAAAGDDPQADRRAKREAARRRRLGETVAGALATWLKDRKQGPWVAGGEDSRAGLLGPLCHTSAGSSACLAGSAFPRSRPGRWRRW
jgi:hypothetical protein